MDDLSQKLTQVLQNPERMQQVMEMASNLGLQPPTGGAENVRETRQETLVRALLPYLQPKRRARLERAMEISHLSQLAGAALSQLPDTRKEDTNV